MKENWVEGRQNRKQGRGSEMGGKGSNGKGSRKGSEAKGEGTHCGEEDPSVAGIGGLNCPARHRKPGY